MDEKELEIKELREKLLLSERRYDIAIGFSDVIAFDYDVITKKIKTQHEDFETFGVPAVLEEGVEEMIASNVIAQRSWETFRELYKKIDSGEPSARATIYANALDGSERVIELLLVNIFNECGEPVSAVGVRRDITQSLLLEQEKKYSDIFMAGWRFIYEADLDRDILNRCDERWASDMQLEKNSTYSQMVKLANERLVAPEFWERLSTILTKENITSVFESGSEIISFQYKRGSEETGWLWSEQSINIIKDDITGDIKVRSFIRNINDKKEKEIKALEEQRFYEKMVSSSEMIYEINVTRNQVISGQEKWQKMFGISGTKKYSEWIEILMERTIHPEDKETVLETCKRENILEAFSQGKAELICEYRRLNDRGDFIWMRLTMHVFEDTSNSGTRAFVYVEDVNEEKSGQQELIYRAQHDLLTGLYNKVTFEEKVISYLSTAGAKVGRHAFLIMDIDFFKDVNDTFGHAFGDAFLSQTGAKLKALFREDDILGRIGGDEFVVFMKNVQNERTVTMKADEMLAGLADGYSKNGVLHEVTVSIGIAVYKDHGKSYGELYKNSDTALYSAKENGRNRFEIFDNGMKMGSSSVREIEPGRTTQTKTFEDSINDYIFRMLYESTDKSETINTVLELMGRFYNVSRVYIFENLLGSTVSMITYQWCDKQVAPRVSLEQSRELESVGSYESLFEGEGCYHMQDISHAPPELSEGLRADGVKSMLQFSVTKNGAFVGFIGFDECKRVRLPTHRELSELRSIANVVGIFITEMRAAQEISGARQMATSIVDGLDSFAYVCVPDSYRLLFINRKMRKLVPDATVGEMCYKAFWSRSEPCEGCPMEKLKHTGGNSFTLENHNKKFGLWLKATASWIDWVNTERVCLIESADITKYVTTAGDRTMPPAV